MACINIDPATPAVDSGRGLHWDTKTECLYFVDAFKATVHCFKPCNNRFTTAVVGGCNAKEPLSFIIPVEGKEGVFLVGMKNKICCIKWDGEACTTGEPSVVAEVDKNEKTKITSAKVDAKGRLWAGNSGEKKSLKISDLSYEEGCGGLYCLAGCGGAKKVKDCLTYSGGFEWSCDKKSFYFTDATKMIVDKYDYCEEEPKICNPKPILQLKENNICGIIKGMTQDCSGKLYLANYLGCQVVVFDPKCCKVVNNIKIPAKEVFSVCWGGPQSDILFVSTANGEPNPNYPCAGRVFQVTGLGDKGMPAKNATMK